MASRFQDRGKKEKEAFLQWCKGSRFRAGASARKGKRTLPGGSGSLKKVESAVPKRKKKKPRRPEKHRLQVFSPKGGKKKADSVPHRGRGGEERRPSLSRGSSGRSLLHSRRLQKGKGGKDLTAPLLELGKEGKKICGG